MHERIQMRCYYKLVVLGVTCILVLISCTSGPKCTVESARLLGRLYYLSNPMGSGNDLVAFVNRNRTNLTNDGALIKCAEELGKRLIVQSLSAFSRSDYDDAYGSVLNMGGTMDQVRGVAGEIQGGTVDMFMMGQELLWLAKVLPPAVNGNWGPFNTTGTESRNMMRQILPIYQMMMATDPAMAQLVNRVIAQFGPLAEYQVVMLADMVGILQR